MDEVIDNDDEIYQKLPCGAENERHRETLIKWTSSSLNSQVNRLHSLKKWQSSIERVPLSDYKRGIFKQFLLFFCSESLFEGLIKRAFFIVCLFFWVTGFRPHKPWAPFLGSHKICRTRTHIDLHGTIRARFSFRLHTAAAHNKKVSLSCTFVNERKRNGDFIIACFFAFFFVFCFMTIKSSSHSLTSSSKR